MHPLGWDSPYVVRRTPFGLACSCKGYTFNRDCKHVRFLKEREEAVTNALVPQLIPQTEAYLSTEQVELIKRTIARGASNDELELFLQQCNRTKLDPFSKQIYAVKRWDSKDRREVLTFQVSIDGLRLIADRTDKVDGQEGPYWCGKDGKWMDVWLLADPPAAAKVLVWRKGCTRPFTGIARYLAYAQYTKEGVPNHFWAKMPDHMLAKCAEALALRKAFPQELSGLYTGDEAGASLSHPSASAAREEEDPEALIGPEQVQELEQLLISANQPDEKIQAWLHERFPDLPDFVKLEDLSAQQAAVLRKKLVATIRYHKQKQPPQELSEQFPGGPEPEQN